MTSYLMLLVVQTVMIRPLALMPTMSANMPTWPAFISESCAQHVPCCVCCASEPGSECPLMCLHSASSPAVNSEASEEFSRGTLLLEAAFAIVKSKHSTYTTFNTWPEEEATRKHVVAENTTMTRGESWLTLAQRCRLYSDSKNKQRYCMVTSKVSGN